MVTNTTGPTRFVDDATAVENVRARIAREYREKLPRQVDHNGRVVEPSLVETTGAAQTAPATDGSPPIIQALAAIAAEQGVNFDALVDSRRFLEQVVQAESTDPVILRALVSGALRENPGLAVAGPAMKPNPAQGSSGAGPVPAKPLTPKQRVAQQLAKLGPVDGNGHPISGRIV